MAVQDSPEMVTFRVCPDTFMTMALSFSYFVIDFIVCAKHNEVCAARDRGAGGFGAERFKRIMLSVAFASLMHKERPYGRKSQPLSVAFTHSLCLLPQAFGGTAVLLHHAGSIVTLLGAWQHRQGHFQIMFSMLMELSQPFIHARWYLDKMVRELISVAKPVKLQRLQEKSPSDAT